jgi:hypothetical protein
VVVAVAAADVVGVVVAADVVAAVRPSAIKRCRRHSMSSTKVPLMPVRE